MSLQEDLGPLSVLSYASACTSKTKHMTCLLLCLLLSLVSASINSPQATAPETLCSPESCAQLVRTLVETQGACQMRIQLPSQDHYQP